VGAPSWLSATAPLVLSGRLLAEVGLQLPTLLPVQALVFHLSAVV
jgi:alpha-galactosidase